ncbi:hypothetical protein [Castellaniella sp.]|uniref:hypothetical protein n=1 Tax=Castellaniella sp. TaxID=1955812 RepID=UPI003A905389
MNITHSLTRTSLALATALGFALAGGSVVAATATSQMATSNSHGMNWFGGPAYTGAPALQATAALVAAGGGAEHFTFDKALVSMLGEKTVNAEVAKLTKQYGEKEVKTFIDGMTYAVKDGLMRATEAGVKLPEAPADLKGTALAKALVQAGTVDGTFWSGYLFDKALSHDLHNKVMADIEVKFGHDTDKITHKVLNQAMYDVAQALGDKQVKLASLH